MDRRVKPVKILPHLRPGGSERLLLRKGALCLIIIAFTRTKKAQGFGRKVKVGP